MVEINPRVNLYLFRPHPRWRGVAGAVAVAARDFQRAGNIALREAACRGIPGKMFSILEEDVSPEEAQGHWTEIERYRDVEDTERLVFMQFGREA
ncbi:MAG: hypothetical protein ACLFRP_00715 [Puniceicoccaceae bacterium]